MSNYKLIKVIGILIVAAALVVVSIFYPFKKKEKEVESVVEVVSDVSSEESIGAYTINGNTYSTLDEIVALNSDTIGWLKIPGTPTDNPVVLAQEEGKGQNYYLDHNFNCQNYSGGTLYLDYRTTFTKQSISRNLTIYGHHMIDGSMFGHIQKYRDISFYKEHPYFTFDTIYGNYDCQVFALYVVDLTTEAGLNFDFRGPDYASEEEYLTFIKALKDRSEISTAVEIGPNDSIINLCTCTYVSNNARLMVAAKLVPRGEGGNVDVSAAYKK